MNRAIRWAKARRVARRSFERTVGHIGEFAREAAVLVAVFGILDPMLKSDAEHSGLGWYLRVLGFALLFFVAGTAVTWVLPEKEAEKP